MNYMPRTRVAFVAGSLLIAATGLIAGCGDPPPGRTRRRPAQRRQSTEPLAHLPPHVQARFRRSHREILRGDVGQDDRAHGRLVAVERNAVVAGVASGLRLRIGGRLRPPGTGHGTGAGGERQDQERASGERMHGSSSSSS